MMDTQTANIIVCTILTIMIILQHLFIIHCMNLNKTLGIENEQLKHKLIACNNRPILDEMSKIDPRISGADVLRAL